LESAMLYLNPLNPVTEGQRRLDLDIGPDLAPDIVGIEVENDSSNY
jgi:hypothetical protein